ncbi:DUF5696 domain-containing protein [Alkalicoccobacillus porphyridii]|uniref:Uncharacterized protein n=1 Tax=Alkalicoccobacillus porphyridii TaxID=2597270 RepID=A0A554A2E1_9BACI|nr:DUF5696 domain-containing protein [Alkalicoccobacillus porphyridii]TSB47864.1 hypothetical protein FN960_04970 [Alkalicoccobacillus porphyridii]
MTNVYSVRLLAFFLVLIILSGCSENTSSGEDDEKDLAEITVTQEEPLQGKFEDSRLEHMKGMAENESLQLFVEEETANMAVHNKNSGEIWYSNPPERDQDSIASGVNADLLSSQLQMQFLNQFGQGSTLNTFSDSIAHEQYRIEEIPDGIRVVYQFGQAEQSAGDLPLMLSQERFEELTGLLDSTGERALMIAYTQNRETGIYERNDSALNGLQLQRALDAFEQTGYSEEDLEQDMAELNFTQESEAGRVFLAAIEYTLDGDSLLVRVPVSDIQFSEQFPVHQIAMMRFFGAADSEEEGSIFVPDGSGALIHFNNGKTRHPSYQQSVFGTDLSTVLTTETRTEETVRLPVFGLIRDESEAMLGIIEEGASVARINADISGRLNSYNSVYPTFTVVGKGDVTLEADQQERTIPRFQEEAMKSDFAVRYVFLDGEDATYTGMASYYRDYLVQQDQLPLKAEATGEEDIPFFLQLIGSATKQKHFAGVPYRSLESLTTFEQAEHIIEEMKAEQINNIQLNYTGWFNKGVHHKVADSISVDRSIGGRRGLDDFIDFTEAQGVELYPEVAMLNVHSTSGFSTRSEASRTLTSVPATIYPLNLALNSRDRTQDPSYVLSPRLVEEYTASMLHDFSRHNASGVGLRDLADSLNSDFRRNEQLDRTESEAISKNALELIQSENLNMMASGGNSYALPYLKNIINAPMSNSGFKLQDEAIPFYQMVIRGHIDYSGAPYNLSTNLSDSDYILKALEYGANVHFKWMYEPNETLKDTSFNYLYAVNYNQWFDQAVDLYHEVNDVLKNVANQSITSHQKLDDGVFETIYENGVSIIVNYNHEPVTVEGEAIEAQGYLVGGDK